MIPSTAKNGTAPALVAFLRGLAEAVLLGGIGYAITVLTAVDGGQLAPWAPIGLLALRQLEGLADQIDPTQRRSPERGATDLAVAVICAAVFLGLVLLLATGRI